MSNTAVITPYRESRAGAAGAGLRQAIAALAKALAATDEERAILERYRQAARRERLSAAKVSLRLADGGDLLGAARSLRFVPPASGLAGLAAGRPVELRGVGGESLLLQRTGDSLSILSANGRADIDGVVARTVERRIERQLAAMAGTSVTRRVLPNGEVELTASGVKASAGGSGKVTAQIAGDGKVTTDISCIAGSACEKVLAEVADATAGTVEDQHVKADYYADPSDPGELARIQVGR